MDEALLCPNCKIGKIVITQFKMIVPEVDRNKFHFIADAECKKCKTQYKLEGESFAENPKT